MTLATGTTLSRYEIRSQIGAGGMGEVFRAHDPKIGRDVAIKVLPADFSTNKERLARFEQEAQAAGALNHPNILSIYDVDTHDGVPYVVSELLEGETLRELIGGAPLPHRKAQDYAMQIARGLAAAHEQGIVHRDIKPENIFVTKDGRVKILDFGLAKLTERDGDQARSELPTRRVNTDSGTVMGTVGYMSPEQLRGQPVDARTDIFSLGCVLYEMFSGRRAFHRDSAADTISAILREDPPDLSATNESVSPGIERIVRRCLEKNREERFHSASDLAFALEALSGTQGSGSTTTAVAAEAPRRAAGRGPLVWIGWLAALLLLVSTITLAAFYFRRASPQVETVRFHINAPENRSYAGSLALSPDGRRLAFVTGVEGGETTLWVRALDELEAHELPGTAGAAFPFWSPDGRFIGFFAQGKLKKIDITGGTPQPLADVAGEARGGAWGPDGTIIFAPAIGTPILKIPAAGGAASPVTELDKTHEQTSHRWPSFLPDGRHFLFFARGNRAEAEGIFVGSLDSKEVKFLVNTKVLAAYAQSTQKGAGHLLFMRDRTLVAQTFDPAALRLSGEPFAVAEGVLSYPTDSGPTGYAAFSTSTNGHLSYQTGNALNLQLSWFDRAGKPLGPVIAAGGYSEPTLSPDGKRIVANREDTATPDLWILETARGVATRFTFDPATDVSSVWSPDGGRIAFASNCSGHFEIYQKPASGAGGDEVLLRTERNAYPDDWSSDGRFIIYEYDGGPQNRSDLMVVPLAGDAGKPFPFLQTGFNEGQAQFSPDGKWVAYASDESGRWEVYVQSFPSAGGKWQISTGGGNQPHWRRDGRELFYLSPDGSMMAVQVAARGSFEAGAPVTLFKTRAPTSALDVARNHFTVAADGQRFLVNSLVTEGDARPITVVLNWAANLK